MWRTCVAKVNCHRGVLTLKHNKMKKHLLASAALVAIIFTSCSKDREQSPKPEDPKTVAHKQLQKDPWQGQFVTTEFILNGIPIFQEKDTISDITLVFTSDKIISYEGGVPVDTSNYSMLSADSIQMDTMRMGLDVLTATKLRMRSKFETDSVFFPGNAGAFITFEFKR